MDAGQWLEKARAYLERRHVPEPRANAEWLLASALQAGRSELALRERQPLSERQQRNFWGSVEQRARRIPLAYVLGNQPFMGLEIKVSPAALIPRPETEGLVCEALELLKPRAEEPLTLLELGTGTGCIAIALARALPQATIYATDVSQAALRLAEQNALAHHVARRIRFVQEDLFGASGPRGWADLAISNPPYIPTAELARLEPELLCEPRLALDGGKDGLAAIRAIVAAAPGVLKPGGWLALEIGSEQGQSALGLLADAGFEERRVRKDLQGLDRVALARR